MFQTLFKYPRVMARHQTGRFAEARNRFLNHCAGRGLADATLLRQARELLVIAERIDITAGESVGLPTIEAAADRWAHEQRTRHRVHDLLWSRTFFIQTATSWFRFLGCLDEPKVEILPWTDRLADFAAYQRDERGLSPVTISGQGWHVKHFLNWLNEQNRDVDQVSLADVDIFLANQGKQGWGRVSVATSAKALRAFFRHAARRGWCAANIAAGIDGPRLFQHEGLPAGPAWPDVQRLIAGAGGGLPQDVRDRAILLLLAIYGLRSGEVRCLRLEDVDWDREIISITRPKPRRTQQYPLVSEVGKAILQYLQSIRPRCARREIFLTLKPPFRQLSASALYGLVNRRLAPLGIHLPRCGPHSLRHACAGHLVAEGFSLKQIGDHLGHRSAYATRIYAKVDLVGLREVADFDLGGLR